MPVAPASSADLLDLLKKSGVVSSERLAGLSDLALPEDPRKAAEVLIGQKILTRFQAQQLLAGRHKGFRIGAYAILELLGRGGMGAVYLAEHLELHRKVAIKILVPAKGEDQKLALDRFLREARSAAALDHPNIVHIFDVARYNDVPYLVMEYVEGDTLQQIIDKGGPVPYPTAAEYVAQAAAGLQHAHEKGFTHRDIKPGNLMRDKSGTIKILDMGLARSTNAADKLTAQLDGDVIVGTADFIAPEQAMNLPTVDVRADIYSLGATFFALVTGKPPFDGNTAQKLLQHQLKTAPTLVSIDATIPQGLSEVVAQMLEKKPEDRFQTPADVIAALTPWMGNSAKIFAGLSRTNLGQSVELQVALAGIALSGSSKRLTGSKPGIPTIHDSAEVNPSDALKETGAVAAAITTREPSRPPLAPENLSRKTIVMYSLLGFAVLAAGGVAGWITLGKKEPPPSENPPDPRARVDQGSAPQPKGNANTPPLHPSEKVVLQLDLAAQQPFTVRSTLIADPNDATKKSYRLVSKSGAEPPPGWKANCWETMNEIEYFSDAVGGKPALGIRSVQGPASAMLFSPVFTCGSGTCRLKFEYQAPLREKRFGLKFKPSDTRPAWNLLFPPVTGDTWRTEDLVIDMKGATSGWFEFHNTDEEADAALRIRSLTVSEVMTSAANTPPLKPTTADPVNWAEGPTVFTLDVGRLPGFRVQKEQFTRLSGEPENLPEGVGCQCWKPKAVGEFRCEKVQGESALCVTNLNEEMSGQFYFQLEGGLKVPLEPGKGYRVKIGYCTKNEAMGLASVQLTPGYKNIASAALPASGGKWETATLSFIRPPADTKVEMRMTIDNTSVGEGNTLCICSLQIVELIPPGKK